MSVTKTSHGGHLNRVKHGFRAQTIAGRSDVDGYSREKDDFFPTPERATRALLTVEKFDGAIWECACGDGAISRILEEMGHTVISSDLVDRGYGDFGEDFLLMQKPRAPNIVTNPPFKLAVPFAREAVSLTTGKVAMLLKLAFLEGRERSQMFRETPLARVWTFSQRLAFVGPRADEKRKLDGGGMMAFAWFVWDHAYPRERWGKFEGGWLP